MSSPLGTVEPEQIALFVECYHRNGGDAVDACVKARIVNPFYSMDVVAARLMERPEVAAALATMKKFRAHTANAEVTRESIVSDMQLVYERCVGAGDAKGAIAAKRLQAELLKMLQTDLNINIKHDVTSMTDSQLMEVLKRKPIDGTFEDVTPHKQGIAVIPR